jgi:hypothetical protein
MLGLLTHLAPAGIACFARNVTWSYDVAFLFLCGGARLARNVD